MWPAAIDSFVPHGERQKEERTQNQKEEEPYWKNKHQKKKTNRKKKQNRKPERERERETYSTPLGSYFKALKDAFEGKLQQNASFHKDKIPFLLSRTTH